MSRMFAGPRKVRNVAVFISGAGSTLQALLEMHHQFDIKLVVTNRKSVAGVLKAKRFGKPVLLFSKEQSFENLSTELEKHNISLIVLAGFMKILPESFVNRWQGRMINIHPSLLPDYKGLNAAERSWNDNAPMGITLHYVTKEMDEGETVLQKKVMESPKAFSLNECELFMRSAEQRLLRELTNRMAL
jgi:formyltetrahydrofolate-dependent phosphoribosylglycinamide formyltransferase